jgi:hypothetical protein
LATARPLPSVSGGAFVIPIPTLEEVAEHVPTRVRVAALGIDLPVIAPSTDPLSFPACDVASYVGTMSTPGQPGATYLYAHARTGMFLPILERSRVEDGRSMLGAIVEIFTADDLVFRYRIARVIRHLTSLDDAYRETAEEAILQTSEGPRWTAQKVAVVAKPIGRAAAGPGDAHPRARPRSCG